MRRLFALFIIPAMLSSALGQVKQLVTKSTVNFEIKNLGLKVHGNLSGLHADINFDPANPANVKIEASVETATINTESDGRDKHLKSDDYFDVEKFPKIIMKSSSIKHKSGDNYTGQFYVTIKDKTKMVEVPFKYTADGKTGTFNGEFKINRLDYGVGGKSMILSDEVTVDLSITTEKE